jgi:hypothetical protein
MLLDWQQQQQQQQAWQQQAWQQQQQQVWQEECLPKDWIHLLLLQVLLVVV